MLTNWRVWYLTTVAAVGGAIILGVTAPVRAAEVTYTLENAELTNDDAVTGSLVFDTTENAITQASISVSSNGTVIDSYGIDKTSMPDPEQVALCDATCGGRDGSQIWLAMPLTGAGGQTVQILTGGDAFFAFRETGAQNGYEVYDFKQGSVTDESAGPSSVPEPSSIMATVTAVTLGVVLRAKKRKV